MRRDMKFSEWVGVAVVAALIAWAAVAMLDIWLDARLDNAWHERREIEGLLIDHLTHEHDSIGVEQFYEERIDRLEAMRENAE